ncbi:murein transglycosylase A [Magnetospirillum molischianum]|uniref:peptidoglycan lytic exotransglycosylase n=1 Tax=Magnetospirillum molischianum DSM 120 TaxID=1150626 RepID=H8FN32_MAGML|nr:MltA domain-containing protein [Magnetospirillum molischianum]CCG39770.1 Membrane-bound lytic murein transglycosylase [Magnetospirillum molischianum DSM 120]
MRALCGLVLLLLVSACAPFAPQEPPAAPSTGARMGLQPIGYDELPGWSEDSAADVLPALLRTCDRILRLPTDRSIGHDGIAGTAADWYAPCAAARRIAPGDDDAARAMFETLFQPWQVSADGNTEGLFTGYFEPEIAGSKQRKGRFSIPVLGKPSDLVSVDLGRFRPEMKGEQIVGRVEAGRLLPYPSRKEIENGGLDGRAPVLVWTDDLVDFAIMQIQGSGRVRLEDGSVLRLGVAGTNGHKFVGIGKVMRDEGVLSGDSSMPGIRAWLKDHPDQANDLLARNPRYIFYAINTGDGPLGTEGVALTPERSMAIDPRHIPLGAPVWVDTTTPDGKPLRRLMMAQDTGAAIKGPVRGDLFWGSGAAAFAQAGRMKSPGRLVLFLPQVRTPRLALAR